MRDFFLGMASPLKKGDILLIERQLKVGNDIKKFDSQILILSIHAVKDSVLGGFYKIGLLQKSHALKLAFILGLTISHPFLRYETKGESICLERLNKTEQSKKKERNVCWTSRSKLSP